MESVLFFVCVVFLALVLLYVNYRNRRCAKCNRHIKTKKYLWFDPRNNSMFHICEECFFDVIVDPNQEEK